MLQFLFSMFPSYTARFPFPKTQNQSEMSAGHEGTDSTSAPIEAEAPNPVEGETLTPLQGVVDLFQFVKAQDHLKAMSLKTFCSSFVFGYVRRRHHPRRSAGVPFVYVCRGLDRFPNIERSGVPSDVRRNQS